MLVCKIEIWPGGNEAKARELQRILITNVGGTAETGQYEVVIPKSREYARSAGPADLLLRALIACIAPRSRDAVTSLGDPSLAPSLSETAPSADEVA